MTANYATVDEAKAQRGLTPGDTADDATLARLIEVASRKIDNHCNVAPGAFLGETQTRYYTAHDSYCLVVDNLLAIASSTGLLTDNGYNRNYSATWPPTAYDLYPYNATLDGVPYWRIDLVVTSTNVFPAGRQRGVKITGTFGYSREVPAEVKEACLLLISRYMTRKGSDFGTIGGGDIGIFRISPMDPDVMELLRPFREIVAG